MIWKETGWGTILFLAALTKIDPTLYEAAAMDGANAWRRLWHVSLPGIRSVIFLLLILRLGYILNTGFEQMFLQRNAVGPGVSEVLDTLVYFRGLQNGDWGFSAAVGLVKGVVGLVLVLAANAATKRFGVDHQQYGGYHTLMVYWMYDRAVPNPELMIDSSLSLQHADGHFGGGCCADMDVIDATVSLARQYGIRERQVADAMERALPWVLSLHMPGWGFRDYAAGGRNEFGWNQCEAAPGQADPCSDFFRAFSVALCSEVVPSSGFAQLPWQHHGSYGHGVRPRCLLRESA